MIKDLFATSGFSLPKHPTELRLQRNSTRRIGLLSGNLVTNADAVVSGASARVCDRGVYGFASIADMSESGVAKVLLAAAENAQFLGQRAANNLGEMPPLAPCHEPLVKQAPEIPQRTLLDFVRVIDNHIATSYTNLSGRSVGANCLDTEKLLYSTDGEAVPVAFSHSLVPRANIVISLTINDSSGAPVSLSKSYGGYGFFNELFTSPDDLYGQIAILYEKLLHKSEGVHAEAGTHLCVIGSEVSGILAHEAVGHTVESDLVLGGSVAGNLMNEQVASELVTLVDFAHTCRGLTTPVPVIVDDEGIKASDAILIENGVLRSYMHNRLNALKMGHSPQGNARADIFSDEPLIRMRNTAILPGKSQLEDLIASVDKGYYLVRSSNGQADTTSEFMFGIAEGYEITNGRIGQAIRDTTISGVAFDMLKTVDMISSDMTWGSSGWCGKKQTITVGMGGPALRCRINIGGR